MTNRPDRDQNLRSERGAVLYVVALMMVVFLGVAAMAIDYGIWFTDRSEAQRAAEASAHAGASILMLSPADEAGARAEAELFAERNTVRNEVHDVFPDQDIDVLVDEQKMRVRVQRSAARGNPLAIDNGAKPVPITGFGGMFLDHWDGGNEVWVRFMRYQSVSPLQIRISEAAASSESFES